MIKWAIGLEDTNKVVVAQAAHALRRKKSQLLSGMEMKYFCHTSFVIDNDIVQSPNFGPGLLARTLVLFVPYYVLLVLRTPFIILGTPYSLYSLYSVRSTVLVQLFSSEHPCFGLENEKRVPC